MLSQRFLKSIHISKSIMIGLLLRAKKVPPPDGRRTNDPI